MLFSFNLSFLYSYTSALYLYIIDRSTQCFGAFCPPQQLTSLFHLYLKAHILGKVRFVF